MTQWIYLIEMLTINENFPITMTLLDQLKYGYPNSKPVLTEIYDWSSLKHKSIVEITQKFIDLSESERISILNLLIENTKFLKQNWPLLEDDYENLKDLIGFEDDDIHPEIIFLSDEMKKFQKVIMEIPMDLSTYTDFEDLEEEVAIKITTEIFPRFNEETIQVLVYRHFFHQTIDFIINFLYELKSEQLSIIQSGMLRQTQKKIKTNTDYTELKYSQAECTKILKALSSSGIIKNGKYTLGKRGKSAVLAILDYLTNESLISPISKEIGQQQIAKLINMEFNGRFQRGSKIYLEYTTIVKSKRNML